MAPEPEEQTRTTSRRRFVAASGLAGVALVAGCQGGPNDIDDDGDSDPTTEESGGSGGDGGDGGDGGGSETLSGDVNIAGSSTVFPLATQLKEEFQAEHPDVSISIQSTGSGGGFQNHFCVGNTDFNNASRPVKPEEETLCSDNGVEFVELKVATDALTVIVNPENDWLDCITTAELAEIWRAGDPPETWQEVNPDWPDEELGLYGPTEASGTFDYFSEVIIGEEHDHRMDHQATENDNTIIQAVSREENAMGYMGFAYYSGNADSVKALGIDDGDGCVEPSLETAKSGEYAPLSRPLFTYPSVTAMEEKPQVAAFAEFFVESSTSEEIVADAVGYVPNTRAEADEMLAKLRPYIG